MKITHKVTAIKYMSLATRMPVVLLGKNASARVLRRMLDAQSVPITGHFDPVDKDNPDKIEGPQLFVKLTAHPDFEMIEYPSGSVVLGLDDSVRVYRDV